LTLGACDMAMVETTTGDTSAEASVSGATERVSTLGYFQAPAARGEKVLSTASSLRAARVNEDYMECLGSAEKHSSCPIDNLDFTYAAVSDPRSAHSSFVEGRLVVEGWMERTFTRSGQDVTTLYVLSAWEPVADRTSSANIFAIGDANIVCVLAPCPAYSTISLNLEDEQLIHALDLRVFGDDPRLLSRIDRALDAGELLVAGAMESDDSNPEARAEVAASVALSAENIFLPVQ